MKLYNIISETFNVAPSELSDSTVFLELEEWDSMAHMMFITTLEDEYAIDFEGDDIVNVTNVEELKELLTKYQVEEL
jgi:acyl carrier protein